MSVTSNCYYCLQLICYPTLVKLFNFFIIFSLLCYHYNGVYNNDDRNQHIVSCRQGEVKSWTWRNSRKKGGSKSRWKIHKQNYETFVHYMYYTQRFVTRRDVSSFREVWIELFTYLGTFRSICTLQRKQNGLIRKMRKNHNQTSTCSRCMYTTVIKQQWIDYNTSKLVWQHFELMSQSHGRCHELDW